MDVDQWSKWITLTGALVGAVAGAWSLYLQLRGKRDTFKVGMGTIRPEAIPETCMHVVSSSDHPIQVADYGFIEEDGQLCSIPFEAGLGAYIAQEGLFIGSSHLESRGDSLVVGYCRRKPVLGSYALTNLQSRPKIAFSYDVPLWVRIRIRLRVIWKGKGYLR